MKILDGKKLADEILRKLKKEIKTKRLKLKLAVVLVGEDSASKVFIRKKQEACKRIGVNFELSEFPSKISRSKLKKEIDKIVKNPANSGIVIQLPLPRGFNPQEFLNLIPPEKNIEVFSPVVCAISYLLKEYRISLKGKKIVLVGTGRLVGLPLALWLSKEKANFEVLDKFTKNISSFVKKADIIISGVGKPNLIAGKMVKRGVVVIDAGTTFRKPASAKASASGQTKSVGKGKLVGDVDFKSVAKKASYITPVPGGVGPLTVACLLENLVKISKTN